MAAVLDRGPDVWLVADGDGEGLWAAGTILDTSRAVVHAPLSLFERPAVNLVLIASSNGQPESFVGVVPEVTVLGDGLGAGQVFALLRVEGAELRPRPDVIDDLVRAAVGSGAPLTSQERMAQSNVEALRPPAVPPHPQAGGSGPDVHIRHDLGQLGRPWYCYVTPWYCMPAGPEQRPRGSSNPDAEPSLPSSP